MSVRRATALERSKVWPLLANWVRSRDLARNLRWRYDLNPHGGSTTWVAEEQEGGRIIACTSCLPRRVFAGEREVVGCIGADTFVQPEWRGRGVATALYRAVFQELGELGLDVFVGFGTPGNVVALQRAGLVSSDVYRRFALPISAWSAASLAIAGGVRALHRLRGRHRGRSVRIELLSGRDVGLWRGLASLWEAARTSFDVGLVKDESFFEWRYGQRPEEDPYLFGVRAGGRFESFAALRQKGRSFDLYDHFAASPAASRSLIIALTHWLRSRRARMLTAQVNDAQPFGALLRGLGFLPRERRALGMYVPRGASLPALARRPEGWHLLPADRD